MRNNETSQSRPSIIVYNQSFDPDRIFNSSQIQFHCMGKVGPGEERFKSHAYNLDQKITRQDYSLILIRRQFKYVLLKLPCFLLLDLM